MTKLYDVNTTYWPTTTTTSATTYPTVSNNWTYWYPSPINHYFYQIICPAAECGTANWGELDTVVACSECGAQLKAVAKKVDYEIEIAGGMKKP